MNSSAGLSLTCVSELGFKCLFAPNYMPYVKTPILAMNSKTDASMATGTYYNGSMAYNCTAGTGKPCDAATVNAFGRYITTSMRKILHPPNGAFLDACYHHCTPANGYVIDGVHAGQAMASWYIHGSESLPNHGFWDQAKTFP